MSLASLTSTSAFKCIAAQYDFAIHGGAVGDIGLGIRVPKGAVIFNVFADVITALTGTSAAAGLTSEASNDLFASAAISGAPWSSTGRKAGIPDIATVGDYVKATVEREIKLTVATAALTAGKVDFYIFYVVNTAA